MLDVDDVRSLQTPGALLHRLVECPVHGTMCFPPDSNTIDAWRELHAQCTVPTPRPPRRRKSRRSHTLTAVVVRPTPPARPFDPWSPA